MDDGVETKVAKDSKMEHTWSLDFLGSIDQVGAEQACSGADVPEKGHAVSGFAKLYHTDAFYTKAAACYIFTKLQSSTT
jgi:hypothetical protein